MTHPPEATWLDIPKRIGMRLDETSAVEADFRRDIPYGARVWGVSFFAAEAVQGALQLTIMLDDEQTGVDVTREFDAAPGDELVFEFDAPMEVWKGVQEHGTVKHPDGALAQLRGVAGFAGQPYTKILAHVEAPAEG